MLPCYAWIVGMALLRCPKDTCSREGWGVAALEASDQVGAFSRFRRSLDLNPGGKNATIAEMTGQRDRLWWWSMVKERGCGTGTPILEGEGDKWTRWVAQELKRQTNKSI